MTKVLSVAVLAQALVFSGWVAADAARIEVNALMQGAAILVIDGHQQMLHSGERSPDGVLLISADPRQAVIEVAGKRRQLALSERISANFAQTENTEIQIPRNGQRQYLTTGEINGHRLEVIVDTGANIVAISSTAARSLGINYEAGQPGRVTTAGGVKPAYSVVLQRVSIGGIAVDFVPAMVVIGDYPQPALLGISYLQHVGMREQDGIMYLRQK